jgi:RNA polymerase sigma-70 factor (ECF subfamily)
VVAGTESAADELDSRYRQRLCALVEREMNQRFRRREDPEDVVQSVFRTFFRRTARGEFTIEHPGALWRLLRQIARRKILKHGEYHGAERRHPDKEDRVEVEQLAARSTTASEARLLGDVLEAVLAGVQPLESGVFRLQLCGYTIREIVDIVIGTLERPYPEILQLRLQGHSENEIAQKLGCGREAVRYRLKRMTERLARTLQADVLEGGNSS